MNQIIKHGLVVIGFIAITFLYFKPLLQDKELKQQDIDHWKGASKEIIDFRKAHGTEPLWTNSMFGGMPAYQISTAYPSNLIQYVARFVQLGLPSPANYVFLYFIGFYILLLTLKIDFRLAIVGALAFGFSSFFFICIEAGHNSQAEAIAFMAPVVAGFIITYRGNYLGGGALTGIAFALELNAGHPQITYYLLFLLAIFIVVQVYNAVKDKLWKHFFKASAVVAVVCVLGLLTNITSLWATADYGKYSTRGPSELSGKKTSTGLDRDYVFGWSYGVGETWTLLIPNYKGGSSSVALGSDESAMEKVNPKYKDFIGKSFSSYWGDQTFTSGPVYVGAIVCFLFLLGLFIVEGTDRWWLLAGSILSMMLAMGKNFPSFNYWMFDHFPGYNKFRSVSMALVIAEFCMPLLAVFALNKIITTKDLLTTQKKKLIIASSLALGITFLICISPTIFSDVYKTVDVEKDGKPALVSEYEQLKGELTVNLKKQGATEQQAGETADEILDNLATARKSVLTSDAWRSLLFMAGAGLLIFGFAKYKFRKEYLLIGVGLLIVGDLWAVDKRYLNDEDFMESKQIDNPYPAHEVDNVILKDKTLDYRVLNLQDPFNDARTSYYHKSIGGYHGAKLKRIQELIEYHLSAEVNMVINSFKTKKDSLIDMAIANAHCLNMLNAKYFIYNLDAPPLVNRHALGNAWFVKDYKIVANSDEEIQAVGDFNPSNTAIIDQRYKPMFDGIHPSADSSSTIKMTAYLPNDLTYQSNSTSEGLGVFSEIYFEGGWNAYIDGKLTPHFRTDYVLRGLRIPAGSHKIEFKFEPTLYSTGEHISLASSLILLVLVGGVVYKLVKTMPKPKEEVKKGKA